MLKSNEVNVPESIPISTLVLCGDCDHTFDGRQSQICPHCGSAVTRFMASFLGHNLRKLVRETKLRSIEETRRSSKAWSHTQSIKDVVVQVYR